MGFLSDNCGAGIEGMSIYRKKPRLTLFARLAIVSGLFLLCSTTLFAWILVKSDLQTLQTKLEREVQKHKADIGSIITEKAIIGDYASIQQYFRSRIKADDIYVLRWTDRNGSVVEASVNPILSSAPAWFQKIANQQEINATTDIVVGGRSYGTLRLKHSSTDGTDAIWHSVSIQIRLILVAFIAFMAATLPLLSMSLRPLGHLVAAADQIRVGNYSARVPLSRLPDMENSIQAFNIMAGTVESLIQQQRDHELRLLTSESRLLEAQRIAHIGCWELEHTTGQVYCSDEIYRIIGRHPHQFDASFEGFLNLIHSDDQQIVTSAFTSSMEQHTPCSLICRINASDNSIKHVQWQWETNFDNAGNPLLSLGTVQDITALKEAEVENQNLMSQLSQSQKIESIGRLAAGIAHDFNNLLTPIIGYSTIMSEKVTAGSRDLEMLNNIMQAAERAKILTHQLLGFGRKQILDMQIVNMNEVISSFYDILRRTIRENINIELQLTNESLGIMADHNQLTQIIMNLVINAQDAILDKGVITIKTESVNFNGTQYDLTQGRYLLLTISDTGAGMDDNTKSRIFEPFYTTKDVGKGSGLGLAMVYGLVKQHKGSISVDSEIDRGSVFKIYLPVISNTVETGSKTVQAPLSINPGSRTVLLVEDDAIVRAVVHEHIYHLGFNVIEAEGAKQAMELCEGHLVDLLVTDVVMPDMSGPELYRCLVSSYPGLKVLYMSGYTENVIDNHGIFAGGINFIQKPFASNDLALKIGTLLDMQACHI